MMTAVIADDEPLIVNGLKKLIDWNSLNIKIVGTAFDGKDAFNLVKELHPNLLISDINMPKLTGIDLLKNLKEEGIETKVIFISGFHEFSYAHAAIKLGALDYLLKPINKDQLLTSIKKTIESRINEPEVLIEKPIELKQDKIPDLTPGYYTVINCSIVSNDYQQSNKNDKYIMNFSLINTIKDYISKKENSWVTKNKSNIFITFFNSDKNTLSQLVQYYSSNIIKIVNDKLKQEFVIAQGKIVDNYSNINECYKTSIENMENRFFNCKTSILLYKNYSKRRYSINDLYTIQGKIIDAIHRSDKKMLEDNSIAYFKVLNDVTYGNREATISYSLGAIVSIKKSLELIDIKLKVLDFDDQSFLKEIHNLLNFDELSKWVDEFLNKIFNDLISFRKDQTHPEIQKIKEYISQHYSENIRLQDLSDIVYLHPNYISGYFKKITGQTFKDYLTKVRMEKAENLFLTTDLKVYELAEKVGFTDYRHFSLVFKKYFGVSPREFLKK